MSDNDTELMLAKAWSSDRLRKQQTDISRMLTSMRNQRNNLTEYMTHDERLAIDLAINKFASLKIKVEHAKEKKARLEEERDKKIKAAIEKAYRLLLSSLEKLSITQKVTLLMNDKRDYAYRDQVIQELREDIEQYGVQIVEQDLMRWAKYEAQSIGSGEFSKRKPIPVTEEVVNSAVRKATKLIESHGILEIVNLIDGTLASDKFLTQLKSGLVVK